MRIKTPEDWWISLSANLEGIYRTIDMVYIGKDPAYMVRYKLAIAVLQEDHEGVHDILEQIWSDAPDRSYIHGWPSWGALCDLCSEYWVFLPKEEQ